ncbi:TetR family transcriptional regulator C-terminal domain-containing protein [Alphaproteobacteria bacterium]|nr:TetR family transcriptional regulator C-terminal domain-containing protein [Alphaproteobacteria bacterium]
MPSKEPRRNTRIQQRNRELITEAALEVFSLYGFRGATLDQIAERSGLSKPNLLYYFKNKEEIHRLLIDRLLETWLDPLKEIRAEGEPVEEIRKYINRKLELARDYPRESRLFANEMLQGAPRIQEELHELKVLVDEKVVLIEDWIKAGKLADLDPYHLFFSIWATTQHYADFDAQVQAVLDDGDARDKRFETAAKFLDRLFTGGLAP